MTAIGSLTGEAVALRSDVRGAIHLTAHLTLLAITGATVLWASGSWWFLPSAAVHGVVLVFLFCAAHECVHRTAFRSRRANDAVALAAGFLLLLPSRWFRLFHAAHHRWTQDPAHDPELDGWKPATRRGIVWHQLGGAYWVAMARIVLSLARGRADAAYLPAGHRTAVVRQARAHLVAYVALVAVSVATRSWLALELWVVPALLGQIALRAYLLAEHTGCPTRVGVLGGTRTTLTNPIVRFLAWNMPFHTEHHLRPNVPFHQLPAVHDAVRGELHVVGQGYARTVIALQRDRWRAAPRRVTS